MPQYPIKAQAYARSPSNALLQQFCDKVGNVSARTRPGSAYYVNETTGSDSSVGSFAFPFATLTTAKAVVIPGDTIFVIGTIHAATTQVLDFSGVRVVGINSPSNNSRARISQTGSVVFSPLVSVTGQGNSFENLATFHGFNSDTAQVCWSDTGGRNHYKNCQFFGGGHATAAANAGCRSLTIGGAGENLLEDCTVGLDTVPRATNANATMEFLAGTARNVFRRGIFQMYSSLAGNVHVKALAGALDRYAFFDDCGFFNAVESAATAIDADFSVNAAAGGACLLRNPYGFGATKLSAAGPVYVVGSSPVAGTAGLAVKAS
jgi:hypothetical protein